MPSGILEVPRGAQARSFGIGTRLAGAFAALLLMMLAVVGVALHQLSLLAADGEVIVGKHLPNLLTAQQVQEHVQGHANTMVRLLTSSRPEREAIYPLVDAEYSSVDRLLTTLAADSMAGPAQALPQAVLERRRQYREAFVRVVEALESGDERHARELFNREGEQALRSLTQVSSRMLSAEQTELSQRQEQQRQRMSNAAALLVALTSVAAGLALYMAWGTTASIVRPLRRVEVAARRIAAGDYGARVHPHGSDEFVEVANAINVMAGAVASREAEIRSLAYIDRLTGLPNRSMLRKLVGAEVTGRATAMILDIYRLRTVNEVLGFETGDALLVEVSTRLRAVVQDNVCATSLDHVLTRMPGGSFCVFCAGVAREETEGLRGRIEQAMEAPVVVSGHEVDVRLVFGMAENEEGVAVDVDDLLRRAEQALDDAKRERAHSAWYVPASDESRARQLGLLSALKGAAADGQLEMWLQPKACLRTGRTVGMEGLVRWRHPVKGYIAPAEFIPFAERSGSIGLVTRAMLDRAAGYVGAWHRLQPHLSVAVNISAVDLRDPSLVSYIAAAWRRHGAPLHLLRLEITESSLMENAETAIVALRELRALGIGLSVDDFGTGYSSLAYLSKLPVDELKVDRSFVAHADTKPELRSLLKTIIELGHSLGLSVTAEGVERAEELAVLTELGCDVAQGYLVSRPLAPQAAARYVESLSAGRDDRVCLGAEEDAVAAIGE